LKPGGDKRFFLLNSIEANFGSHRASYPMCIATGYQLVGWCLKLGGDKRFSLLISTETNFGAHPASYPVCIEGSFPKGKEAAH
jgi:hypothetical protein